MRNLSPHHVEEPVLDTFASIWQSRWHHRCAYSAPSPPGSAQSVRRAADPTAHPSPRSSTTWAATTLPAPSTSTAPRQGPIFTLVTALFDQKQVKRRPQHLPVVNDGITPTLVRQRRNSIQRSRLSPYCATGPAELASSLAERRFSKLCCPLSNMAAVTFSGLDGGVKWARSSGTSVATTLRNRICDCKNGKLSRSQPQQALTRFEFTPQERALQADTFKIGLRAGVGR